MCNNNNNNNNNNIVYLKQDNWYYNERKMTGYVQIHESRTHMDNPDPQFQETALIPHAFEREQFLKIECWDSESNGKHELIGVCEIEVGELLHSQGSLAVRHLLNPETGKKMMHKKRKMYQTILLRLDKQTDLDRDILIQLKPKNIPIIYNNHCNAYFKIRCRINDRRKKPTLSTIPNQSQFDELEVFNKRNKGNRRWGVNEEDEDKGWILFNFNKTKNKNELNTRMWPVFEISLQRLCNCEFDSDNIAIEIWNANLGAMHDDLVGIARYSFNELKSLKSKDLFYRNRNGQIEKRGSIEIVQCYTIPNIIDFIQAGTNFSMMCAIDFSKHNGNPTDSKSLHYCSHDVLEAKSMGTIISSSANIMDDDEKTNKMTSQYEECLYAISSVLKRYDDDQVIPTFGFGLKTSKNQRQFKGGAQHCFHLNNWFTTKANRKVLKRGSPYVKELRDLYHNTVQLLMNDSILEMGDEVHFSSVLAEGIARARESHNKMVPSDEASSFSYHVLLLLASGHVAKKDQQRTRDLLSCQTNK